MLDIYAGNNAINTLQEHGFKQALFSNFLGASGGPKWFVLFGLDKYLMGQFFANRTTPLNLVGSSAGAFRAACLCQSDPVRAITAMAESYSQTVYSERPSANEISVKAKQLIDHMFGQNGVDEILQNKTFIPHLLVNKATGLASSNIKWRQSLGMFKSLVTNAVSRRNLTRQYQRHLFSPHHSQLKIVDPVFDTHYQTLTAGNIKAALLASGSIPLVMESVSNISGAPKGHYWDGGIIDYHFDFQLQPSSGLTLYPHFDAIPKPGWFDKYGRRISNKSNYSNTVMLVPSDKFVQSLPQKKIPDRKDFTELPAKQRIANWQSVLKRTEDLADVLHDIIDNQTITRYIKPLPF